MLFVNVSAEFHPYLNSAGRTRFSRCSKHSKNIVVSLLVFGCLRFKLYLYETETKIPHHKDAAF